MDSPLWDLSLIHISYEQKDHEQKQNEKIDPLVYEEDGHVILNTQLLVQRIVEAKLQGVDSGRLAYCLSLIHISFREREPVVR